MKIHVIKVRGCNLYLPTLCNRRKLSNFCLKKRHHFHEKNLQKNPPPYIKYVIAKELIPTYYYISTIPTLYTQYYAYNLYYDYEKKYINNYILCVTNYDVCLEKKEYKSVF